MNSRPLNARESQNLAELNRVGCNSVLLFITETGLKKAILDATDPMRQLFSGNGVHDFAEQLQGPDNKVIQTAYVLSDEHIQPLSVSFYRPETKTGDPRMWFYGFKQFAKSNDVFAVFVHEKTVYALNLTQSSLARMFKFRVKNRVTKFLAELEAVTTAVSRELLELLRAIANAGPLRAVCKGDTAIGRSIETALGIPINSSPQPDYKGIEIKSGRSTLLASRENRANLFACVPDWNLSSLKSSRAILERFGYQRDDDFKLYCTVSTRATNSQGLRFEMMDAEKLLREFYAREPVEEVCVWPLERLHSRLIEKHTETFWVKAKSTIQGGVEWFHLESVTHTARPDVNQFDRLLADGTVTMDHLIKRVSTGKVSEKGPLFKVEKKRLGELFFGEPRNYSLVS